MPKQSEALILRTYPFHEADLLVTLFTRTEGKIRGVAKAAKRSKRRFGGALEPLTHVLAHWEEKEKQELARLDSCEIIASPLVAELTYPRVVALSYVAEVIDQLLPDREPSDDIFRLALSVVKHLEAGNVWINSLHIGYDEMPFGGVKFSGIGREHGPEALEYYLETKGVVVATS